MSKSYLSRHPHYYEVNGDEDVFAPFTILSEPLPTRESRVFESSSENGHGVTYASHSIKLAYKDSDKGREFFILMEHGGGREISRFHGCYNYNLVEHILTMPERAQYSLLHSMHQGASEIARSAALERGQEVLKAHVEKRIRKRTAGGRSTWKVESRQEQTMRFKIAGKTLPEYVD